MDKFIHFLNNKISLPVEHSLTQILVSVKWEGFIKFINAYTQRKTEREKESGRVGKGSRKQLWKFQINETNFGKIHSYMHQIFDV